MNFKIDRVTKSGAIPDKYFVDVKFGDYIIVKAFQYYPKLKRPIHPPRAITEDGRPFNFFSLPTAKEFLLFLAALNSQLKVYPLPTDAYSVSDAQRERTAKREAAWNAKNVQREMGRVPGRPQKDFGSKPPFQRDGHKNYQPRVWTRPGTAPSPQREVPAFDRAKFTEVPLRKERY